MMRLTTIARTGRRIESCGSVMSVSPARAARQGRAGANSCLRGWRLRRRRLRRATRGLRRHVRARADLELSGRDHRGAGLEPGHDLDLAVLACARGDFDELGLATLHHVHELLLALRP